MRILLLDSDRNSVRLFEAELGAAALTVAHGSTDGLELLAAARWDLVLLDADFSGAGLELLGRLRSEAAAAPVVLLTARASMELTLEAMRQGAHDVLLKPPPPGRIGEILASLPMSRRVRPLPEPAEVRADAIVGASPSMMAVFRAVGRAAASDATVLILGQSGTGKELIARVLHSRSARAGGPFVAINCAAIPENLLESELFGHEKGAFTGAIGRRIGRFERASGGSLFLDEIGDMSVALQSKILRAVQEREIERVGGAAPVPINVRILAATNRDLAADVASGRFREDLFYRLAVVVLELPPLSQRGDDIDLLADHFVALAARDHKRRLGAIAEDVYDTIREHPWPGNVRQLRNAMERAVVMSTGDVLLPQHLPADICTPVPGAATGHAPGDAPMRTLHEMEVQMIRRALRESGGNLTFAAQRLGIHRNTLRRKLVEHGIRER